MLLSMLRRFFLVCLGLTALLTISFTAAKFWRNAHRMEIMQAAAASVPTPASVAPGASCPVHEKKLCEGSPAKLDAAPAAPATVAPDKGKQYDVLITDEFDDKMKEKVLADAQAAARDHDRVLVKVTSPGGEAFAMFQVIQGLEDLKKNHPGVKVVCYGDVLVASAAAITLEAVCDERYVSPEVLVLFHEAQGGFGGGNEATATDAVREVHVLNEMVDRLVSERLGMTLEDYRAKVYGRNWWLSSQELMAIHGADGLVARMDMPAEKEPTLAERITKELEKAKEAVTEKK